MSTHKPLDVSTTVDQLVNLAKHVKESQHQPGKIALKFGFSALSLLGSIDLDALAAAVPGIRETHLKALSRTAEIDYDPTRIDPTLWDALAQLHAKPYEEDDLRKRLTGFLESAQA